MLPDKEGSRHISYRTAPPGCPATPGAAAGGLLSSLSPRLVLFLAGAGALVAAGAGWLLYARRHARARQSPAASPPAA
jgi:hypothetical protein